MTTKPSKFAGLIRSRQESEPAPEQGTPAKANPRTGSTAGSGKRSNPDFAQVTAYIPKALHAEAKINLIRNGNREFSELIAELLAAWNEKQSGNR